jgi:excinuclease UvrABC helicase subunit UvrB
MSQATKPERTIVILTASGDAPGAEPYDLVEFGFRLPSALDNRPLTFDEMVTAQP